MKTEKIIWTQFNHALQRTPQAGFTLMELLLYMLIFPTLLLIIYSIFGSIIDSQLESKSYSSIDLDTRYIQTKLAYDFQSADSADNINNSIILPATGSAGDTLKIKINSITHTYLASTSGRLVLYNPTLDSLTSSDSSISALTFQRIGPGLNTDTIKVDFTIKSNIKRKSGTDLQNFTSTFAMP